MKVITVTDAWHPQVNGVVRTIEATNRELELAGHTTAVITPLSFPSVPCPGYREIRLSLWPSRRLAALLDQELAGAADAAIHIATEGPLGQAARRYCLTRDLPFTTAYHTRFPQYLAAMFRIPERWTYRFLRHFHGPAASVMAPTPTVERELRSNGLANVSLWTRGVDLDVFTATRATLQRPQASGLPVRRPGLGREEHPGVSRARPARHQGRGRDRAGT